MLCPNTKAITNGYLSGWVQDYFSQNVPKFGFGDEKMYIKRGGATPFFSQDPRNLDSWMGRKWKKGI